MFALELRSIYGMTQTEFASLVKLLDVSAYLIAALDPDVLLSLVDHPFRMLFRRVVTFSVVAVLDKHAPSLAADVSLHLCLRCQPTSRLLPSLLRANCTRPERVADPVTQRHAVSSVLDGHVLPQTVWIQPDRQPLAVHNVVGVLRDHFLSSPLVLFRDSGDLLLKSCVISRALCPDARAVKVSSASPRLVKAHATSETPPHY